MPHHISVKKLFASIPFFLVKSIAPRYGAHPEFSFVYIKVPLI